MLIPVSHPEYLNTFSLRGFLFTFSVAQFFFESIFLEVKRTQSQYDFFSVKFGCSLIILGQGIKFLLCLSVCNHTKVFINLDIDWVVSSFGLFLNLLMKIIESFSCTACRVVSLIQKYLETRKLGFLEYWILLCQLVNIFFISFFVFR